MDDIVNQKKTIKLTQWGNSKAVRIPADIVEQLGLKKEQPLTLTVNDGSIILTPIKKRPTNIHKLFEGWEDDGQRDHELDWGESKGKELPW